MLERMAADLAALRTAGQFRELAVPRGIDLSSNDYLGLSGHPRLKEAIARALAEDERVASTGSRLLTGNHERWEQLEADYAEFVGVEGALYFPSGYAANIGLLSSILKAGDTVFSDAANHASLIDGIRLARARKVIFPHLDLGYLEDALRLDTYSGQKVIIVESIFSMEGDRAPLGELMELCERFGAFLVVDEAHAVGVEGPAGRGLTSDFADRDRLLATVHPCGKAFASAGAFVTGSGTLRQFLINHARTFIFTTALPPYYAAHVREAVALAGAADAGRDHLRMLCGYLRERMRRAGFDTGRSDSQIIPVMLGSNETALRFASALSRSGFSIRAIRPPTVPAGTARLRVSVNAGISTTELDAFVNALVAARETGALRE